MLFCTSCGKEISAGVTFCVSCGKEQVASSTNCSNCGKVLEENEKFCSGCGNSVEQESKPKPEPKLKEEKFTKEGKKIINAGPKPNSSKTNKTILSPPLPPTPKKKKRTFLGCLGKTLLILFLIIVVGIVIIWNLPEDKEDFSADDTNIPGIVDIEPDEQLATSGNFEELDADLSLSNADVGNLNQNGIQLIIPDETFDQKVKLQVREDATAPSFDNKRATLFGIPYQISIDQKSKRLNKPVTVKFKVSEREISKLDHPEDLWIGYYNGKQWDYFKPLEVNTTNKFIKFETYHLSLFSKAKPTKEEQIKDFAEKSAVEQWSAKNNNAPTKQATEKIVKQILGEKLGLSDKSITQDIVESIMNENDYQKLLVSYNDNKMDQFGQDLAILAGKKIVEIVTEDNRAKTILGAVTTHASKINTGINIARALSEGNLEQAAKDLSNEIIGTFPITRLFREAARITDQQIVRWRDQELEAAYKVFVNGSESNIPFWGYNVEPGNFDDVWIQMKGLKPQLLRDAKQKYALANKINIEDLGPRALEIIEAQTKENLRNKFEQREKEEKEIEKLKEQNIKLIKVFEDANLLNKYRFGYTEQTSFELRLQRLYKIKDMIVKDTKSRVGFMGVNEGGIIQAETVARLIQIWYNPDNGKQKYREELIKLGYIKEVEKLELSDGPWEISSYEAKEIYSVLGTNEFKESIVDGVVEAIGGEKKDQGNEARRDLSLKAKQENAEKKLIAEYKNALELGIINAPLAEYEKSDELMFLYQYNPVLNDGEVYTFSVTEGFDLEKGDEIKFILQLKSANYFEAKVFYKSKGYVSIDYIKGKLKN